MSSAASVVCLCSALLLGQGEDKVIHKAPAMEVRTGPAGERDPQNPQLQQNYLMYFGIYWGRNYLRPDAKADWGDPQKDFSRLATTYYHAAGPVGWALQKFNWFPGPPNTFHADARSVASLVGQGGQCYSQLANLWSEPPIGVIGLNAGTEAAYARPMQTMHFFERNPDLIALSQRRRKKTFFHFIPDAQDRGAAVTVFKGEHRATLAKLGGERFYHLIAIETVKEGADEKLYEELLTKEAMQMMMGKLVDGGVLCFHTSHRHIAVDRIVGSVAQACGYAALVGKSMDARDAERGMFSSEWVMVARKPEHLQRLRDAQPFNRTVPAPEWSVPNADPRFVWKDGAKNTPAGLWRSDPQIAALRNSMRSALYSLSRGKNSPSTFAVWQKVDAVFASLDRLSVAMKNSEPRPQPPAVPAPPKSKSAPIKVETRPVQNPTGGPLLSQRTLLYRGINVGTAFDPPDGADRGNPSADLSRLPTTYYHPRGPAGCAFELFNCFPGKLNTYHADARLPASLIGFGSQPYAQLLALWSEPPVAVLGLEVGTPAGYARPFQTMHFTERVPAIRELSLPGDKKPATFRYVQDALDRGANVQVFPGEPRATFAKHGGAKFYRLILVDTYKEGIRTVHEDLLTREGMAMLMGKLQDDGILCYHISNRYYDLEPIVVAAASDLGYACMTGHDSGDWRDEPGHFSSSWVMVARNKTLLQRLRAKEPADYAKVRFPGNNDPYWNFPKPQPRFLWTDSAKHSMRGLVRFDPFSGDLLMYVGNMERELADLIGYQNVRPLTAPLRGMIESLNRRRVEAMNR